VLVRLPSSRGRRCDVREYGRFHRGRVVWTEAPSVTPSMASYPWDVCTLTAAIALGEPEAAKYRNLHQVQEDSENARSDERANNHRDGEGLHGDSTDGQGRGNQYIAG